MLGFTSSLAPLSLDKLTLISIKAVLRNPGCQLYTAVLGDTAILVPCLFPTPESLKIYTWLTYQAT